MAGAAPGTTFGVEPLCCSACLAVVFDTNYIAATFPESRKLFKALQQLQHPARNMPPKPHQLAAAVPL